MEEVATLPRFTKLKNLRQIQTFHSNADNGKAISEKSVLLLFIFLFF